MAGGFGPAGCNCFGDFRVYFGGNWCIFGDSSVLFGENCTAFGEKHIPFDQVPFSNTTTTTTKMDKPNSGPRKILSY
ncbi:hypothetical protein D3H55_15270 [Bacillus salacetis]|uniref:Uncharacterized protein n=1 Tax=Bacillus salacetis TaxID=2315464 RepID=A0A3A1QXI6_9BACI|nr:hypothetical protein D3H55_15270 [Bacillus salacetis]